jgi:hypothetical protein
MQVRFAEEKKILSVPLRMGMEMGNQYSHFNQFQPIQYPPYAHFGPTSTPVAPFGMGAGVGSSASGMFVS